MPQTVPCSMLETLRLYVSGKLPESESDAIDEHLEHCVVCRNKVEELEHRGTGTLNRKLYGMHSLNESLIFHDAGEPKNTVSLSGNQVDETEIPEQIGSYKIHRVLGHGGMGVVYEAEQPNLRRHVAIKVVKAKHRLNPEMLARFQRELEAVSRLEHTNIVRAYDAGITDDNPYLVMELLDGNDLGSFVLSRPPLSLENFIKLGRQAVAGLHYAHQAGFGVIVLSFSKKFCLNL